MISKILYTLALVAVVVAQHGHDNGHGHHKTGHSSQSIHRHDGHAEKVVFKVKDHKGHEYESFDYRAPSKYDFEYKVEDKHTGDIKSQHETRNGDVVKGYYALHDPHGHVRKVEYHGDKKSGFHATVHHGTHHVVPEHHHHH